MNRSISSATHCDATAAGEQITIRFSEFSSAVLIDRLRSLEAASFSRSWKIGDSLRLCAGQLFKAGHLR